MEFKTEIELLGWYLSVLVASAITMTMILLFFSIFVLFQYAQMIL